MKGLRVLGAGTKASVWGPLRRCGLVKAEMGGVRVPVCVAVGVRPLRGALVGSIGCRHVRGAGASEPTCPRARAWQRHPHGCRQLWPGLPHFRAGRGSQARCRAGPAFLRLRLSCLVTEPLTDPPQLLGTARFRLPPTTGESHIPVCETGLPAGSHRGRAGGRGLLRSRTISSAFY